jgi:hypothetical protein
MNSADDQKPSVPSPRRLHPAGAAALAALVCLLGVVYSLGQNARSEPGKDEPRKETPNSEEGPKTRGRPGLPPGSVEVRFTDGSKLRLIVRDERLPLESPYGKLSIPIADIRHIDFATRTSEDVARRIEAAISDLANPDFKVREAATNALLALGIKAYAALLKASKHPDAEVVRRAEELLARVRESVPEEQLLVREHDVVVTEHSKISGRIDMKVFQVTTPQFGDVQLKLADALSLHSLAALPEPDLAKVEDAPDNLASLQGEIGKSFLFRVTGALGGAVWGTGTYTSDSSLATVVVHAGVLRVGQTGVVKVTIVPPLNAYEGSTSNGVTSSPYAAWPGAYRVEKRRAADETR